MRSEELQCEEAEREGKEAVAMANEAALLEAVVVERERRQVAAEETAEEAEREENEVAAAAKEAGLVAEAAAEEDAANAAYEAQAGAE